MRTRTKRVILRSFVIFLVIGLAIAIGSIVITQAISPPTHVVSVEEHYDAPASLVGISPSSLNCPSEGDPLAIWNNSEQCRGASVLDASLSDIDSYAPKSCQRETRWTVQLQPPVTPNLALDRYDASVSAIYSMNVVGDNVNGASISGEVLLKLRNAASTRVPTHLLSVVFVLERFDAELNRYVTVPGVFVGAQRADLGSCASAATTPKTPLCLVNDEGVRCNVHVPVAGYGIDEVARARIEAGISVVSITDPVLLPVKYTIAIPDDLVSGPAVLLRLNVLVTYDSTCLRNSACVVRTCPDDAASAQLTIRTTHLRSLPFTRAECSGKCTAFSVTPLISTLGVPDLTSECFDRLSLEIQPTTATPIHIASNYQGTVGSLMLLADGAPPECSCWPLDRQFSDASYALVLSASAGPNQQCTRADGSSLIDLPPAATGAISFTPAATDVQRTPLDLASPQCPTSIIAPTCAVQYYIDVVPGAARTPFPLPTESNGIPVQQQLVQYPLLASRRVQEIVLSGTASVQIANPGLCDVPIQSMLFSLEQINSTGGVVGVAATYGISTEDISTGATRCEGSLPISFMVSNRSHLIGHDFIVPAASTCAVDNRFSRQVDYFFRFDPTSYETLVGGGHTYRLSLVVSYTPCCEWVGCGSGSVDSVFFGSGLFTLPASSSCSSRCESFVNRGPGPLVQIDRLPAPVAIFSEIDDEGRNVSRFLSACEDGSVLYPTNLLDVLLFGAFPASIIGEVFPPPNASAANRLLQNVYSACSSPTAFWPAHKCAYCGAQGEVDSNGIFQFYQNRETRQILPNVKIALLAEEPDCYDMESGLPTYDATISFATTPLECNLTTADCSNKPAVFNPSNPFTQEGDYTLFPPQNFMIGGVPSLTINNTNVTNTGNLMVSSSEPLALTLASTSITVMGGFLGSLDLALNFDDASSLTVTGEFQISSGSINLLCQTCATIPLILLSCPPPQLPGVVAEYTANSNISVASYPLGCATPALDSITVLNKPPDVVCTIGTEIGRTATLLSLNCATVPV